MDGAYIKRRLHQQLLLAGMLTFAAGTPTGKALELLPPIIGRSYHPENVYQSWEGVPKGIRRVAVLPLACDASNSELAAGREALEPILRSELTKTRKFEVVSLSADALRSATGKSAWSGGEALPPDFLAKLRKISGAEAVLFCELTGYRAYTPLMMGWRLRLVNLQTGETLWAVDEVLDASQASVDRGVRRYERKTHADVSGAAGDWVAGNSPRRFGQYALATLFATLPEQ